MTAQIHPGNVGSFATSDNPIKRSKSSPGLLSLVLFWLLVACTQSLPPAAETRTVQVQLTVDGKTHNLTTTASNVRELLEEAGVSLNDADEITPPLFTPLEDGMQITIVRVTESIEIIPQSIPFERRIVRNEAMDADDPPVIIQGGKVGLQEQTVRIVYRDGLESERWVTQVTVIEPAQDEIVMVGIGTARGNVLFSGLLAYISDGTAVLLRGNTAAPEQLNTGGPLDGRVFSLSPTGSHLLYTVATTTTTTFSNSLWVVSTAPGATPRPLGIDNVLWAGWNPARTDLMQIAYTTARPTNLPPGWEANNDLWVGNVLQNENTEFNPRQLIESYPATYGWWGGNYAWSPNGRFLAYSYANEIGLIEMETGRRVQLQQFTEYNTLSDWVWVPSLSWSPDGRFLAFTRHGSDDPRELVFDSWLIDTITNVSGRLIAQSGMWAHPYFPPITNPNGTPLAFLRAVDPLDSQRSSYTLWLMDQDGSNARQIFPPPGETSHFSRDQYFMAWGPSGQDIAFIFNNALYLYNLEESTARRITQDDAIASHPTWAPYGAGLTDNLPAAQPVETLPTPESADQFLPEE